MYKHLINTVQNKYNLIIASYFTVNSNYTNLFCPFTSIYITICVTDGISQNVGVSRPETWQERFGGGRVGYRPWACGSIIYITEGTRGVQKNRLSIELLNDHKFWMVYCCGDKLAITRKILQQVFLKKKF